MTREPGRGTRARSYPHLAVPDGGAVLRQPQDVQVHVVLSPPPQAEAESLVVPLQVHGVELRLLGRGGETRRDIKTEWKPIRRQRSRGHYQNFLG